MDLNILKRILSAETFAKVEQEINEARMALADFISPSGVRTVKPKKLGATTRVPRGRSKPVRDPATGIVYSSITEGQEALGVSYPTAKKRLVPVTAGAGAVAKSAPAKASGARRPGRPKGRAATKAGRKGRPKKRTSSARAK